MAKVKPDIAADKPVTVNRAGAIRTQRIPDQVASDIRKRILRGEISHGDGLPAETELMAEYRIARPTLREALRILESEQFIVVRRGGIGGALVQRPSLDVAARQFGFVLQDRGVTMADVHRARAIIEPPALSALASTVTSAQLKQLEDMLVRTRKFIGDPLQYSRAAADLRAQIVEMAGAATVALLMRMLREVIERHRAAAGGLAADRWSKLQDLSLRSHKRLIELISQGAPGPAEDFWRGHLIEVEQHLGRSATTRAIDILD